MGRKSKDMTGMKFGRLTVIERAENDKHGNVIWVCQCECGNITKVRGISLRSGNTASCGCAKKEATREMMKEKWQDGKFRQMKSDKVKEQWQDGKFRQMKSDKMRELNKKLWQDEEMKWRMGYKGGITPISEHLRKLNNEWFDKCKQEANYTCQLTGKHGVSLHTHHLYAFSLIVLDAHNTYNIEIKQQVKDYTDEELKLLEGYVAEWHKDSSNAVVLSKEVHNLFHSLYGRGDNTPEQFEEFKKRFLNGEFDDLLGDVLTVVNKL